MLTRLKKQKDGSETKKTPLKPAHSCRIVFLGTEHALHVASLKKNLSAGGFQAEQKTSGTGGQQ